MSRLSEACEEICDGSRVSRHENSQLDGPFVNSEARRLLEIIVYATLIFVVSVLGSVANVVNIIIFFKQGFKDSVNISLCGLAVSDLCSLLPLVWKSISYNPLFRYSDIGFDSVEVQYILAGWPHASFLRTTSWITAFITFERCVCVVLPMKVKDIITPKRTLISVVVIFLVMIASVVPAFYIDPLSSVFNAQRNRTLVSIGFSQSISYKQTLFSVTVIEQMCPFFLVTIFTTILINNMKGKFDWRKTSTFITGTSDRLSSRDKRVIKMVTFISSIFIACLLPSTVNFMFMIHFPNEYTIGTRYENTFDMVWAICNTLDAVNSSVSIIVYYRMSSKFRATFNTVFRFHTGVI